MALEKFELAHRDGKWQFKKNGADRAQKTFATKAEGVAFVSKFGNKHGNCSVRIKKADGSIQEQRTYVKTPQPARQKKFRLNILKGKVSGPIPDFFEPMSDGDLALWEGGKA